jgi:hypothetical protein
MVVKNQREQVIDESDAHKKLPERMNSIPEVRHG